MTEIGVVKNVIDNTAEVAVVRKSSCGENCGSCSGGCKLTENIVTAKNTVGAKNGDVVEIEASSRAVLGRAFLIYILPLLLFFIVYFIAERLAQSEKTAVISAFIAFAAVFCVLHFFDKRKKLAFETSIVKIIRYF